MDNHQLSLVKNKNDIIAICNNENRFNINTFTLTHAPDFSSRKNIISSMRSIEEAYWDYIDNYNKKNRFMYPYIGESAFISKVTHHHGFVDLDISTCMKIYNRYKKNLPTAGIVLYHKHNNTYKFIVVKVNRSKVWGMPKGKEEPGECPMETAIREFHEETGIDMSYTVNKDTAHTVFSKTVFYLVESDCLINVDKYRTNEILAVKWVDIAEVLGENSGYSKQSVLVAQYLEDAKP